MANKLTVLLSFLLLAATSFAQTISNLKLGNKLSILNDRSFLEFPATARNVARGADIMSAGPNADKETRIILDTGKQRLVFFARELFVTSSKGSFLESIKKDDGDYLRSKLLLNKDSIMAVLSTPQQFDSTQTAILVNNLTVRTPDGSVFSIGAFINPDAFQQKDEYIKLTEKVFNTLTRGKRKLVYQARTENFPIPGGKKSLSVKVPQGYVITKDAKYDFEVLHFEKVKDIADTTWRSLTLYMGHHPSYFYTEYEFDENDAEKVLGHFIGQKVEWLNFKNTENRLYLKEQKIPGGSIEEGLLLHIAMLGDNPRAIDELTRIIEDIKVKE
jgi:hypothetical protein